MLSISGRLCLQAFSVGLGDPAVVCVCTAQLKHPSLEHTQSNIVFTHPEWSLLAACLPVCGCCDSFVYIKASRHRQFGINCPLDLYTMVIML